MHVAQEEPASCPEALEWKMRFQHFFVINSGRFRDFLAPSHLRSGSTSENLALALEQRQTQQRVVLPHNGQAHERP